MKRQGASNPLDSAGGAITIIEEELDKARIDMTRLSEAIATLDREVIRIKRGIKRTQINIRHIDKTGGKLEREAAAYKGRMSVFRNERTSIRNTSKGFKLKSPLSA